LKPALESADCKEEGLVSSLLIYMGLLKVLKTVASSGVGGGGGGERRQRERLHGFPQRWQFLEKELHSDRETVNINF